MFKEKFLRTGNNYDMDAVSRETGLTCKDPSLTQQQFAEEANINTIVERFGLTGELPNNVRMPAFADFEESVDYQTSLNAIIEAQRAFATMPASIRERFGNDPGAFVDFCGDEKNRPEAERVGLVAAKEFVPPKKVDEGVN